MKTFLKIFIAIIVIYLIIKFIIPLVIGISSVGFSIIWFLFKILIIFGIVYSLVKIGLWIANKIK